LHQQNQNKTMKKLNTLFVALLIAGAASAQTWSFDKAHAKLGFGVTHLLVSEVEGNFKTFNASVTSTKEDFSDAVIELSAETASINTDNEQRDGHLKSPDFFDAAKFTTVTFKSTSFTKVDGKKYKLAGNLTMHGVTKPVELEVIVNTGVHPFNKKNIAGFKVTGKVKRADFGIGEKIPGTVVSDEVEIRSNVEFVKG
jgi:polyisoprenoid-binding protein YceI